MKLPERLVKWPHECGLLESAAGLVFARDSQMTSEHVSQGLRSGPTLAFPGLVRQPDRAITRRQFEPVQRPGFMMEARLRPPSETSTVPVV